MNKILIKEDINGYKFLYFDKDYACFLDRLCGLFNFENNYQNGIRVSTFISFLEKVSDRFHISREYILQNCDYFINDFNLLMQDFKQIGFDMESILDKQSFDNPYYWVFKREYINSFLKKCDDSYFFEQLTEFFGNFLKFQTTVFKSAELINLKDSLFNDFRDVAPLKMVQNYQSRYDALLSQESFDVAKIENLYREIQAIILDDFKANITDINDYKPGNKFRFLCHSTNSVEWDSDYLDNYLSTSLLTEAHTDTYRCPYGFIVNPQYIVSMDCEDLYTRNSATDESELSIYSVLPKILSMNHLISGTKIYNEVVVRKDKPENLFLGIFCVTDGSRELNPIYVRAKLLQKSFPNLPIIDLDVTLYLPLEELSLTRNELIDSIREELGITSPIFDGYYDMYEPFWEKFMELKRNGDYGLLDILSLFSYYYNVFESDSYGDHSKRNKTL